MTALILVSVLGGTSASANVASADTDRFPDTSTVEQVENETETAGNETETETVTPGDHEYPNEDETVTTSSGIETTPSGDTTEATATEQDTPGFGVVLAVVALIAAALLAVRRED